MTGLARRFSRLPLPVELARQKARLAGAAELRNVALFGGLPNGLFARLGHSPRLFHRLHAILFAEFGQPALFSEDVTHFHLLPEPVLERASFLLALSYDIAMRGGAIKGEVLASIGSVCDADTLANALRHAAGLGMPLPAQDLEPPVRETLMPNGWSLLLVWADAAGVNPNWRICDEKTQGATLITVRRDVACALAAAILSDITLSETHGW